MKKSKAGIKRKGKREKEKFVMLSKELEGKFIESRKQFAV